mgnify:FL=1
MLNSKSKQVGFVGTLLFHLVVFLLCLFSSIGYTSIEPPVGIEIQFVSQELEIIDKLNNTTKASSISSIKNEEIAENVIVEQDKNIQLPNEQDTLTLAKSDLENQSIKVSIELEDALSKLIASNQSQINKDSVDSFSDDTIVSSAEKTKLDNTQDGYVLSDNRLAVRKIKPNYSCEEFGKIVVRVWVNREGKTIKAEPGIRGTTESSSCLFKEAKYAALKTTWTPYFDAPEVQVGQITYNFYKY